MAWTKDQLSVLRERKAFYLSWVEALLAGDPNGTVARRFEYGIVVDDQNETLTSYSKKIAEIDAIEATVASSYLRLAGSA